MSASDDFLNHHAHHFGEVDEVVLSAIEQRVGVERAGKDLEDGLDELLEAMLGYALVGDEDAAIFAGEGQPEIVLEQAGGADQQGAIPDFSQDAAEMLDDVGLERAVLEDLADERSFSLNLLEALVFLVSVAAESVDVEEFFKEIGAQVPGFGHTNGATEGSVEAVRRDLTGASAAPGDQDEISEEHTGGLSADLAYSVEGPDGAGEQRLEITDGQKTLGDADEFKLRADQMADE